LLAFARPTIGCAVLLHAHRPSASLAVARRGHEAAGARCKVLVVSARVRSVMQYDCAATRMMNGGSRAHHGAHVVFTHTHTTTGAIHPRPRPDRTNERDQPRTTIGDRRSAIGELRATIADRCARAVWGGAPGRCRLVVCGLWFYFLNKNKYIFFTEFQAHATSRGGVGPQASQVFRAGVRRNFPVGLKSGTGPEPFGYAFAARGEPHAPAACGVRLEFGEIRILPEKIKPQPTSRPRPGAPPR